MNLEYDIVISVRFYMSEECSFVHDMFALFKHDPVGCPEVSNFLLSLNPSPGVRWIGYLNNEVVFVNMMKMWNARQYSENIKY